MRGDLDDYEDEVTNIKRIAGVKALQKLFKQ
jgi:hypothetical protein